jgi:hypothetical protein
LVADSGKAHFAQYRSGLKRFEDHPEPCSAQNCAGFSHQGTSSGHCARWCIIPHSLCMRVANGWAAPIPVYSLNAALRARICAGTNCAQLCAVPGSAHICTDSWGPDDPSGPPLSAPGPTVSHLRRDCQNPRLRDMVYQPLRSRTEPSFSAVRDPPFACVVTACRATSPSLRQVMCERPDQT